MKSNYTGVWLLLAIALIVVLAYSFVDDVSLFGHVLKKAPFAENLLESPSDAADDSLLTLENELVENTPVVAPVDSTPQSILLIGDSMTLNLALRLSQYAKQNGHSFHAVNWDSSNTRTWGNCDTLSHFIKEFDATYVFISLGSNELYIKKPESRIPDIKNILAQIGDLPYVWIGPPNWKEDYGINDVIRKSCRKGSFFLSEGIELDRKRDHIHPTRKASVVWMDSIMRWIPASAHPIVMDLPADSIGKVNPNVTFLKALNK